ncbi:hypothetical protein [Aeromicrobium sp.]|uniref:hypothetical protein n=1 Tax=Aeromicrobium sp. TaxID=1871063 RepID=UPI003516D074
MSRPDAPGADERAIRLAAYEQMLRLADLFDDAGDRLRRQAAHGARVLDDADVAATAAYAPRTWAEAEEALRSLATGRDGLLGRSVELDADALVLRATVLTYRWIEDLHDSASRTLGAVAGRAIGYLAPRVELGGSLVAAGLVETDAVERDDVAGYLGELAEADAELMEHLTTGGGLVESLQVRALLTPRLPVDDAFAAAARGGRAALGLDPTDASWAAALRDVGPEPDQNHEDVDASACPVEADDDAAPADLAELLQLLDAGAGPAGGVRVRWVAPRRAVVLLDDVAPPRPARGGLRLVGAGGAGALEDAALGALARAVAERGGPVHVMLVGRGTAGEVALRVAARASSAPGGVEGVEGLEGLEGLVVDQVVTAEAPAVQLPALPPGLRVLSLERRSDPVALLNALVNARADERLTLVYDTAASGARTADRTDHPAVRALLERWRRWGYLRSA